MRSEVLRADPAQIEKLGRHLIVGYRDRGRPSRSDRAPRDRGNFHHGAQCARQGRARVRRDIEALQAIRSAQGLPPLLDRDRSGGRRRLAHVAAAAASGHVGARSSGRTATETARRDAVRPYAADVGRSLSGLGVNLNFAPVVDLDHGVSNPNDRYTRIGTRAISSDPKIVADVARRILPRARAARRALHDQAFPRPWPRVRGYASRTRHACDAGRRTHQSDWVPFRDLMQQKSHVHHARPRRARGDRSRAAGFVFRTGGRPACFAGTGSMTVSW